MGFMLWNLLAFVFLLSSFSVSFSQPSSQYSQAKSEASTDSHFLDTIQLNKITADSELYFEGSEILEIDDFESTKSTQVTEKNCKNTHLPPSPFSFNKQHNKLYIAFCCLRIHLA